MPPCLVEAAAPLDEARYFRPNFDGPATLRDPTAEPVEAREDAAQWRDMQPVAEEGIEDGAAEEGTGAWRPDCLANSSQLAPCVSQATPEDDPRS